MGDRFLLFCAIGGLAYLYGRIGIGELLADLFPLTYAKYWYATCYFILIIIEPYIERMTCKLSKEEFCHLILVCIILWSFIPTLLGFLNGAPSGFLNSNLAWTITLFLIGKGIRMFKITVHRFSVIVLFVILVVIYIAYTVLAMKSDIVFYCVVMFTGASFAESIRLFLLKILSLLSCKKCFDMY